MRASRRGAGGGRRRDGRWWRDRATGAGRRWRAQRAAAGCRSHSRPGGRATRRASGTTLRIAGERGGRSPVASGCRAAPRRPRARRARIDVAACRLPVRWNPPGRRDALAHRVEVSRASSGRADRLCPGWCLVLGRPGPVHPRGAGPRRRRRHEAAVRTDRALREPCSPGSSDGLVRARGRARNAHPSGAPRRSGQRPGEMADARVPAQRQTV